MAGIKIRLHKYQGFWREVLEGIEIFNQGEISFFVGTCQEATLVIANTYSLLS